MTNFTTLDIAGALKASLGFTAILFAPGYLVASALNLFGFRSRILLERVAWAIALSFAVSPMLITLGGRLVPMSGLAGFFAAALAGTLIAMVVQRRSLRVTLNAPTIALGAFVLVGAAVVIGELIDWQSGNGLSLSVTVTDQAFRVPFINSVAHTGIPPLNPFFHPGAASPLRYYYFWYTVCAVCMKLAQVSARQALIASSVWAAVGLIAVIALFARHFLGIRDGLYRYILTASLLLTVTGLDLLPSLYYLIVKHTFGGDMEWWSWDQVSSWLDSILWVPHHTASLLCCVMCFLLLWRTGEEQPRGSRIAATVLAGFAAASALGLSIYVTTAFVLMMAGWTISLLRERNSRLVLHGAGAAAVSLLLLTPYLGELTGGHSGTQEGSSSAAAHLYAFGVRHMFDPGLITGLPVFAGLQQTHPILLDQLAATVLLAPGYACELGVFGLVLVFAFLERRRLNRAQGTALGLAVGGLLLMTFMRSSVIGNNDFGYRAALLPCFFSLLLTAEWLCRPAPRRHAVWLNLFLLIGLAGTGFQAVMLRAYVPLHVANRMDGFAGLPEAAYAARSAFAEAAAVIPPTAVVQFTIENPSDYGDLANMLYSERAMATDSTEDCGAVFGGDIGLCVPTGKTVETLFRLPAPSAEQARETCRQLGIGYLAVAKNDPAWHDTQGWVWTLPLVVKPFSTVVTDGGTGNQNFRVVNCADAPRGMP